LIPAVGKAWGRYTNLGGPATWWNQDLRTQVNDRINFTVQRELRAGFKSDVTFFMNYGKSLPYSKKMNMSDPELGYTHKAVLNQAVANPFYRYMTPDTFPGVLRNQVTVSRGSLLSPYPQYTGLTQSNTAGPRNRYRALQMRVQRAYSSGASVLWAYNYNRERNEAFFNAPDEFAGQFTFIPTNNPRHRMTTAGTYDLPFGKGRPLLANPHPVVQAVLGGWSTSSILVFNSGAFLRFGGLDVIGEGSPKIDNPTPERRFKTTEMFRVQTPYTPRLNPWQYEGVTGPKYWNLDTTLSKYFNITERYQIEFKMEAYNLTNSFIWNDPNMTVTSSQFGRSNNQANRGREFQYTIRVHF
ncbi:MAG: carboxypeptidase-like regulatory domain-containing protein, partial [Bryobacteraceae bacterium]